MRTGSTARVSLLDDRSALRWSRCCHGPTPRCWLDPLLQIRIPKRLRYCPDTGAILPFGGEQAFDAAADLAGPGPVRPVLWDWEPDFRDRD
jgi:hypothetical protein